MNSTRGSVVLVLPSTYPRMTMENSRQSDGQNGTNRFRKNSVATTGEGTGRGGESGRVVCVGTEEGRVEGRGEGRRRSMTS